MLGRIKRNGEIYLTTIIIRKVLVSYSYLPICQSISLLLASLSQSTDGPGITAWI